MERKSKNKLTLLVILLIISLVYCSKDKNEFVSSIEFGSSDIYIDGLNVSLELDPILKDINGNIVKKDIKWSVGNEDIVSVNDNGVVLSRSIGFTFVEASVDNIKERIYVNICACAVDSYIYDSSGNIIGFNRKDTICSDLVIEFYLNGLDFNLALENKIITLDENNNIVREYHKTCY